MDLRARLIFHAPMMKAIVCVMLGTTLFACGNKEAQPEATSPTTSAPVASAPAAPVASASAASSSSAPAADEGVVIQLKGNLILVDGSAAGALGDARLDELSAKLKSTRDTWMKVHPGQTFPGRVTLKAEKATPAAGVAHIIDVARAAGYPNAALATP